MKSLLVRDVMTIGVPVCRDSEMCGEIEARLAQHSIQAEVVGVLYLKLYDAVAAGAELEPGDVDMADPKQVEIWKTVQVLLNKVIHTDSYLRLI